MQWLSYYGHVKGVKKVHSAFDSFKKVLMLKNCIYHEPVIPCDAL